MCSAAILSAGTVSAAPVELAPEQLDQVTAGLSAGALATADAVASMLTLSKTSTTTLVTTSTPGAISATGGQAAYAGGEAAAAGVGDTPDTNTQVDVAVDVAGGQYYGVEVQAEGGFVNMSGAVVIGVTALYNPLYH